MDVAQCVTGISVRSMDSSALRPVFVGLRVGLYMLIAGLGLLVVLRAALGDSLAPVAAVSLVVIFEVTFFSGVWLARHAVGLGRAESLHPRTVGWLILLTVEWMLLVFLAPDAAFLVFPLFFCYLHLLPRWHGPAAVVVSAVAAVVVLGAHRGLTLGGVIGPLIGAGVAIAIGLGYRALYREVAERNRLLADLMAAQQRLAATERNAGVEAERTRLAAEIHDTVAQGLSSIQMLLSAAQRADPGRAGSENIELARQTAVDNLAETRRFIRALSSPHLEARTLLGALERVVARTDAATPTRVRLVVDGSPRSLPRPVEATVLRVVQGSLANVVSHARAKEAVVTLSFLEGQVRVDVVDDGVGLDTGSQGPLPGAAGAGVAPDRSNGSFGLSMMRERAAQLGGTCVVESSPGAGTAVSVSFPESVPPATGIAASSPAWLGGSTADVESVRTSPAHD